MLSKFAREKKGFTLIELMIVIAIIAILAAVAIPNFMSARDKARRASAAQALGALRKAMEMYITVSDRYTNVRADLLPYTNVTSLDAASVAGFTYIVEANTNTARYTILGTARDRQLTPCTANQDDVWCVR